LFGHLKGAKKMKPSKPTKGPSRKCSACGQPGHQARTCPKVRSVPRVQLDLEDRTFPGASDDSVAEGVGVDAGTPLPAPPAPSAADLEARKLALASMLTGVFAGADAVLIASKVPLPGPRETLHKLCGLAWAETAGAFGWLTGEINKWLALGGAVALTGTSYVLPVWDHVKREKAKKAGVYASEPERPFVISSVVLPAEHPEDTSGR